MFKISNKAKIIIYKLLENNVRWMNSKLRTSVQHFEQRRFANNTNQNRKKLWPAQKDLPKGFYEYLESLHREFSPRQQELAKKRAEVLAASHNGNLPNYLPNSVTAKGGWHINLPKYIEDQRNQITGPADDAELVVKMLNSGAPGVMLDLEDSIANTWKNLEKGLAGTNVRNVTLSPKTLLEKPLKP